MSVSWHSLHKSNYEHLDSDPLNSTYGSEVNAKLLFFSSFIIFFKAVVSIQL